MEGRRLLALGEAPASEHRAAEPSQLKPKPQSRTPTAYSRFPLSFLSYNPPFVGRIFRSSLACCINGTAVSQPPLHWRQAGHLEIARP